MVTDKECNNDKLAKFCERHASLEQIYVAQGQVEFFFQEIIGGSYRITLVVAFVF